MKIIHRLIGYLQQSIGVIFLLGAGTAHVLKVINIFPVHGLNEMDTWNKNLVLGFLFITLFSVDKACEIFYTPEKYREYTKGMMGGKGFHIPNPDNYFYPTMIDDIGIKRKIAGYVYSLSKISFCCMLGAILYLEVRLIFSK